MAEQEHDAERDLLAALTRTSGKVQGRRLERVYMALVTDREGQRRFRGRLAGVVALFLGGVVLAGVAVWTLESWIAAGLALLGSVGLFAYCGVLGSGGAMDGRDVTNLIRAAGGNAARFRVPDDEGHEAAGDSESETEAENEEEPNRAASRPKSDAASDSHNREAS